MQDLFRPWPMTKERFDVARSVWVETRAASVADVAAKRAKSGQWVRSKIRDYRCYMRGWCYVTGRGLTEQNKERMQRENE